MTDNEVYLASLQDQLQYLMSEIDEVIASQQWQKLNRIDAEVNRLVRDCVADQLIEQEHIRGKVFGLVRLYREVIAQLRQDREQSHREIKQLKVSSAAHAYYRSA